MTWSLSISLTAWESMTQAAGAAAPLETGGILLGHFESGVIRISNAPAVPDTRASTIQYRRDACTATKVLEEQISRDSAGLLGYLGEWHTHPLPLGPSATDNRAIRQLAADGEHHVVLLVLAATLRGWKAHARLGTPDGRILTLPPPSLEN